MITRVLRVVREGVHAYTGLQVVDTDDPHKRPEYPYYSYKITSYIPDRHHGVEKIAGNDGQANETLYLQSTLSLSFNSYHKDLSKAHSEAMRAWEWFKYVGRPILKNEGYVVTNVTAVYDRTIQLTDEYEYRYGFDVSLRIMHAIERDVGTIETWTVNKEE